ncbi:MAG: hypothetical protein V4724_06875 [Pseudomonadota bacterium]
MFRKLLHRAPWLLAGGALILLAWRLYGTAPGIANLLIPAGAWLVLRGLT